MKKYFDLYKWQLTFAVVLALTAFFGILPHEVAMAAGLMLTTASTAQLGNGTTVEIAAGSPTSFLFIGNANDVKFMDGTSAEVDVTHLMSSWKEKRLGLPDGGKFTLKVHTDFADPGQAAALAAKNARTKCQFRIVLPVAATPTAIFEGWVSKFNATSGVDAPISSDIEIIVTGPVTLS